MNSIRSEGLLTAREVARRLSVSERTVWRWTALGILPRPVRPGRRSTRWRAADLQHYLESLSPPGAGAESGTPSRGGADE